MLLSWATTSEKTSHFDWVTNVSEEDSSAVREDCGGAYVEFTFSWSDPVNKEDPHLVNYSMYVPASRQPATEIPHMNIHLCLRKVGFRTPFVATGGFSAAWFMAKPLMEVASSWVGACWLQVQFLVSFSRDSKRRCGPRTPAEYEDCFSSPVTHFGRKFQDPRCGSTRPQVCNEAASRSPAGSTRQPRWRSMRRRCARGLTTYCLSTPRNAKERGRTVRDSFCTGAQEVGPSGWCGDCGGSTP